MGPERRLSASRRAVRLARCPISRGRGPESWLAETSKYMRRERFPREGGMQPSRRFLERSRESIR